MSKDLCYAITNGSGDIGTIVESVRQWAAARTIQRLQIREKRLSARALYDLTVRVVNIARPAGIEVLVNERADVALAAGADGVHLPSRAISPAALRRLGVRMIGVSCHDAGELVKAEAEGADFAVLAPVFAPLSKESVAPPLGLDGFRSLALSVKIPVLALGGITAENIEACLDAGAAGVAGITLFNAFLPRSSTETAAHPEPRSLPL
jgi:thiamine-phosphate pyrophosphorylase